MIWGTKKKKDGTEWHQMMKWLSEMLMPLYFSGLRLQLKTISTPEAPAQLQPDTKRKGTRTLTKEERPPFTHEGLGNEILALSQLCIY